MEEKYVYMRWPAWLSFNWFYSYQYNKIRHTTCMCISNSDLSTNIFNSRNESIWSILKQSVIEIRSIPLTPTSKSRESVIKNNENNTTYIVRDWPNWIINKHLEHCYLIRSIKPPLCNELLITYQNRLCPHFPLQQIYNTSLSCW